jgi:hypothetical protein
LQHSVGLILSPSSPIQRVDRGTGMIHC